MSRRRQKFKQQIYGQEQPNLFEISEGAYDTDSELVPMSDDVLAVPERLRFMSFGSGSSGNCAYVGTPSCGILIDAGVDNNAVLAELAANGVNPSTIQGIILTHDHGDHVRYAYAILRRFKHMRIFATPKAMTGLLRRHSMSRRIKDYHAPIYKEFPFKAGSLTITAFETSHDGTDNAGFCIEGGGTVFVITTDTGTITACADHYIRKAEHLMIEANYDAGMLRNGRYPVYLKARIASTTGHLDNADTARYLAAIAPAGTLRRIFLCHLSLDNNTPQLALGCVRGALEEAGVAISTGHDEPHAEAGGRLCLSVLPRLESSPLIVL